MFSNIRITKIHDTSKYCISVSNLRSVDTVTYTQNASTSFGPYPEVVLLTRNNYFHLSLSKIYNKRKDFESNQEFLAYLKQTGLLGCLIRNYNDLPLKPTTFTCSDLTLVEADLASNPNVKYRFYCCSAHGDTSGLTPVRWQCFQNGILTSDLIYDGHCESWWQYLYQLTGLYWLACGSNGFTENPGKYGVSAGEALTQLLPALYEAMRGHDAELIACESRRGKRIKLAIHNAVQSAFCHPESLCRMIYAKLKTLPEGIRK